MHASKSHRMYFHGKRSTVSIYYARGWEETERKRDREGGRQREKETQRVLFREKFLVMRG